MNKENFLILFPKVKPDFAIELIKEMEINDITKTRMRINFFLAQCAHETASFSKFEENLNYSAKRLLEVFPKYFPNQNIALEYGRKPMNIANRVYANRMGNGDEKSGDGWRYRGRGIIQLTGKNNYQNFAKYLNKTLEETVNFLETQSGIIKSAMFFWSSNNCNNYADKKDFTGLTKRINGGTNGLGDRLAHFKRINELSEYWINW